MTETSEASEPGEASEASANDAARRPRVAPFVVLVVAIVMGGLFVLLANADPARNQTAATPLLDRPAPEAIAEYEDGSTFDLSRRKGSWVVLNFFTSTCIPCQREHPELVDFVEQQQALGVDGAEFYSIVVDDDPAAVQAFFDDRGGGDWPVAYDRDGRFGTAFGVTGVPETWIIDPNGVVRGRVISEVTSEYLSQQIQLMREGAA